VASRKTFAKLLNNNSSNNKLKLLTKPTFSLLLSLFYSFSLHIIPLARSRLNLVDGEYKQKSATQTPSGHLSTTSEAEISCKPGSTAGVGVGVGVSVGAGSSADSGAYQSSKVSYC